MDNIIISMIGLAVVISLSAIAINIKALTEQIKRNHDEAIEL